MSILPPDPLQPVTPIIDPIVDPVVDPAQPDSGTTTDPSAAGPSTATWDQATWLVRRTQDAQDIGDPPTPAKVALPGARAAIDHDRLLAHHDAGHDEHQIVERVNRRWHSEHADRLSEHDRWAHGPYRDAIVQMREQAAREAAEEMRRQAAFEQLLAERDWGE